jgi:DNA invertase Pin-like site-specific DNA recombinase
MVAGVLASLAELELELGRERRAAAREARRARGQLIGRPKALTDEKAGPGASHAWQRGIGYDYCDNSRRQSCHGLQGSRKSLT